MVHDGSQNQKHMARRWLTGAHLQGVDSLAGWGAESRVAVFLGQAWAAGGTPVAVAGGAMVAAAAGGLAFTMAIPLCSR